MSTASTRDVIARPEKAAGAIRGLERLKADFKMAGANATTIERAIDMLRPLTAAGYRVVRVGKFKIGDRVTKISGSSWTGHVVGDYSTSLTPEGYAVESENEPGSVQLYPVAALRALAGEAK